MLGGTATVAGGDDFRDVLAVRVVPARARDEKEPPPQQIALSDPFRRVHRAAVGAVVAVNQRGRKLEKAVRDALRRSANGGEYRGR